MEGVNHARMEEDGMYHDRLHCWDYTSEYYSQYQSTNLARERFHPKASQQVKVITNSLPFDIITAEVHNGAGISHTVILC